jgi:hypothetical protein
VTFKIVDFGSFDRGRWQFAFWTGKDDASPVGYDSAFFNDPESLAAFGKRGQTRIAPEADFALGLFAVFGKIVPSHQLCAFLYG